MSYADTLPSEAKVKDWLSQIQSASKEERAGEILRHVVEHHHCQLTNTSPDEDLERLEALQDSGIVRCVLSTIQRLELLNPEAQVFYVSLADCLLSDSLFPSEEDKTAALVLMVSYPSLPYHRYEPVTLNNVELVERRAELEDTLDELWRLSQRQFGRQIDFCAAYLSVVARFDDLADRAILMSEIVERSYES